jgi:hypothetical protein
MLLILSSFSRTLLLMGAASLIGSAITFGVTASFMAGQAAQDALITERATLATLQANNQRVRKAESQAALDVATITQHFNMELEHEKKSHAVRMDELRAGTRRMRVTLAEGSCRANASATPASAAGSGDDTETAELSPALGAALTQLAFDADANTQQLAACQQLARAMWASVNSYAGEP